MSIIVPPFPLKAEIAQRGVLTPVWESWLSSLRNAMNAAATRLKLTTLTAQAASIATTAVALGPNLREGLYRISYYARITQAATTNSSLTVTIGHTHGAVSCTQAGSAITGNTTATVQSGTFLVYIDAESSITYATSYSSTGATAMQYALTLVCEQVPS